MKKLLITLGSFSMITSTAVLTTSCTYIDVVEKSINNRITQAANTTSHFFKGAILTNSYSTDDVSDNEIDGRKVDEFIYKSKALDIMPGSDDLSSMKQIFSTYFDMSSAQNSAVSFINNKYNEIDGDFYIPPSEDDNSKIELFKTIKSLFDTIYSIIGNGFSPSLVDQIIPLILKELDVDQSLNDTLLSLKEINTSNLHIPTKKDLETFKVQTFGDLQFYSLVNLSVFLAHSFNYDKKWNEEPEKPEEDNSIYGKYYRYTSGLFTHIINNGFNFNFHNEDIQLLINAIYGLSWYIDAFDKYRPEDPKEISDDNHLFNKNYTNNQVFKYVQNQRFEYNKLGNEIDGLLTFFTDIFSGKTDEYSYDTSRVLKILFQVEYWVDENGNERLNPDYKDNFNIDFKIFPPSILIKGTWGKGYQNFRNGLSPFLISLANGLLKSDLLKDFSSLLNIESLSSGIGNLLSTILANVNFTSFIDDFLNSNIMGLIDLLSKFIPDIKDIMETIVNVLTLINSNNLGNRLFHQLMNGDLIGQIIDTITHNVQPSEIRNLKDIFDKKINGVLSISEIATVVLNIIAGLPDLAVKVFGLFNTLSSQKWADEITNEKIILRNESNRVIPLNQLVPEVSNPTDLVIAIKLLDSNFSGVGFSINDKRLIGKEASFYILGLENGTFTPGSILYNISKLYNDGSGYIVKGLFNIIDALLAGIDNVIGEKEKQSWDDYLQSNRWSVWIVDFENFEDISKRSSLTYNIQYRDEEYNIDNTYQVVLSLNGDAVDSSTKYIIESFEKL